MSKGESSKWEDRPGSWDECLIEMAEGRPVGLMMWRPLTDAELEIAWNYAFLWTRRGNTQLAADLLMMGSRPPNDPTELAFFGYAISKANQRLEDAKPKKRGRKQEVHQGNLSVARYLYPLRLKKAQEAGLKPAREVALNEVASFLRKRGWAVSGRRLGDLLTTRKKRPK